MSFWLLIALIGAAIFAVVLPLIVLGPRALCLTFGHKSRASIGRASARSGLYICQRCDSLFTVRG